MKSIRKAVFPVAGLGTRFLPATKAMPKEMLPLVDKPLIQYAVEEAVAAGIEEFIFVTGRGKTAIEDHFDHSFELETILGERQKSAELEQVRDIIRKPGSVIYIRQQVPLGLGHAVWCARHLINNEPFAVLLADDFILGEPPCLKQMIEGYKEGCRVAVMDVPRDQVHCYGILDVASEDRESQILHAKGVVEKPAVGKAPSNAAIVGRYILDPRIFDHLDRQEKGEGGEIQLTDSLGADLTQIPLQGIRFTGRRYDCGSKTGFLLANLAVALARPDLSKELVPGIKDLLEEVDGKKPLAVDENKALSTSALSAF